MFSDILSEIRFSALFQQNTVILDLTPSEKQFLGLFHQIKVVLGLWYSSDSRIQSLECTGKPYLLKAQHSAFNTSDSTTIPLTVQNWQITSFVPDSTDLVVDSSNKCLAVRTVGMQRCPGFHKNVSFAKWTNQIAEIINFLDSTTLCLTRYAASLL